MAADAFSDTGLSVRERKQLLIAQGRAYRLDLLDAGQEVWSGLQVDKLARTAVGQLASNGYAALEQVLGLKNGAGMLFKFLLPLAGSGASLLARKRHLVRPALGSALALTGVAAAAFLAWRWNKVKARRKN